MENRSGQALTYDLAHQPDLATEGIIDLAYLDAGATVNFEPPSITVPPSSTVSVSVTIEAPAAPQAAQCGGYLVFAGRNGGRTYRVPYAGFVGDYQSIQVLSYTPQGFPQLAKRINGRWWAFSWDGFTRHGNSVVEVPNGSYRVRLAVQKALGEDDDPEHWEYWDSPVVTIGRPNPGVDRQTGSTATDEDLSAPRQVSPNFISLGRFSFS